MKSWKKTTVIGLSVLTIGITSLTALAASQYNTPAEAVAGITGRSVVSVEEERAKTGKSYGTIASEEGKLDEFQDEMVEIMKDRLAERVALGAISQERADEMIKAMEEHHSLSDGTGSMGFGRGNGMGRSQGRGRSYGYGNRSCHGFWN